MTDQDQHRPARASERLQHELLVAYRTNKGFVTDWAVNISRGGLFINSREPLPVGSEVHLIVSLPDAVFPFDLNGRVVRIQGTHQSETGPGMAIEFVDVDDEKRTRLQGFVDRMRKELPDLAAN